MPSKFKDYSSGCKTCTECRRELPLVEFWTIKSGRNAGRPYSKCKSCHRAEKVEAAKRRRHAMLPGSPEYEAYREKERARNHSWRSRNRSKQRGSVAKRKAARLRATPLWAESRYIQMFYNMAHEAEAETGRPHHVDHIVPLISDFVCGLHVEDNLQVLEALPNLKKSNREWPDMSDLANPQLQELMNNFYAQADQI